MGLLTAKRRPDIGSQSLTQTVDATFAFVDGSRRLSGDLCKTVPRARRHRRNPRCVNGCRRAIADGIASVADRPAVFPAMSLTNCSTFAILPRLRPAGRGRRDQHHREHARHRDDDPERHSASRRPRPARLRRGLRRVRLGLRAAGARRAARRWPHHRRASARFDSCRLDRVGNPRLQRSSRSHPTITTGQVACCATCWLTEPRRSPTKPPRLRYRRRAGPRPWRSG